MFKVKETKQNNRIQGMNTIKKWLFSEQNTSVSSEGIFDSQPDQNVVEAIVCQDSDSVILPQPTEGCGWGSLQREMVKMILIRRYVPYHDCRNSKPWSVKGVREIFGEFPRKIALKSAA
ncbi:hypothetical protein NPIL_172071 [Nephila pilipes]|uniref:Uncharacterized protein n=1 Tax=Nephila pilipes TaxID=299642 RepID=A0A8X6MUZ5_NEPPI|nr:hypothetical protein NPIL_172071 [Nephila pilipes]